MPLRHFIERVAVHPQVPIGVHHHLGGGHAACLPAPGFLVIVPNAEQSAGVVVALDARPVVTVLADGEAGQRGGRPRRGTGWSRTARQWSPTARVVEPVHGGGREAAGGGGPGAGDNEDVGGTDHGGVEGPPVGGGQQRVGRHGRAPVEAVRGGGERRTGARGATRRRHRQGRA
jgi:hypothetical protein